MALFQRAVLNKYLSGIDEKALEAAWESFTAHFHNPEIQQNIRNSKEEEYQEGFLDDLFVKVLGYIKNPTPDYNLKVEQKNFSDSKKADGALLHGEKVRGVIELKGTETTDLGKVEGQAFGYKNKQPDALYVIISNFEKLRFYIDNAVDFLEFNLFTLTKEEFKVLWLCLGYSNFAKGLPKKIKDASLTEEENVTKKLYKDYSDFKHDIFESVKKYNPEHDPLLLFKKTQKLLDRFLFIFFAEDRNLLPPNSIKKIIQQWHQLKELDEYRPLYERFVKYFGYLNEGRNVPGKDEIFAYNGGLFADDKVLNDLTISDELLYKHSLQLSHYDFVSEVDVNILGHIFEHSLNEIEEINAELKGEEVDSSKTRRKKDGVFYTPKYITKYIVENTVGTLCEEKKAELDIDDERFTEAKRRTKKGIADLKRYREWLLNLTICDPACGSGAFLNQALDFLIAEHKYIDELQAKYHGEALVLSDIENQILENNLFGVDINEESVEIAKLSLWLRTAQKGRKLTSLNNHIKCGNSLIDDHEVAGDKAFNWEEEFPEVFRHKEKQAFHVTWVTHNARTSQRMIDYKVKKGEPFWLNEELEVFITQEIAEIVKEDELNVLAYNICEDHVHILLVCEPEALPNIVRKLKGRSSQKLKEYLGVPKEEKFHLWAQKFDRKPVEDEEGLEAVRNYIIRNREKHNLPPNKGLQPLVAEAMSYTIEHAFRPETTGGFDVVIGNPPYVSAMDLKKFSSPEEYQFLKDNFETAKGTIDLYIYFFERGIKITKKAGYLAYITPNRYLSASYGNALREYILKETKLCSLIDYSDKRVFPDASTYPVITILQRAESKDYNVLTGKFDDETKLFEGRKFPSSRLGTIANNILGFLLNDKLPITEKVINQSINLDTVGKINATSTAREADEYSDLINEDSGYKLVNTGTIDPYVPYWGYDELTNKGSTFLTPYLPKDHPEISENRNNLYNSSKIIIAKIGLKCEAFYDRTGEFASINTNCIHSFNEDYLAEYVLCFLNSKLYNYTFECLFDGLRMSGGYLLYSAPNLRNTYIKQAPIGVQEQFVPLSKDLEKHWKELLELTFKFNSLVLSKFDIEKLSRKLQSWHELTFKQFLKELKKKKVKLTLEEEAEWMEYFNRQKAQADDLKTQIAQTDSEIDGMVYELYGLGEEERKVVEGDS